MNFEEKLKEEFELDIWPYLGCRMDGLPSGIKRDKEKLWSFISQSLSDYKKEFKKAFFEKYQGAGEVFFPYESEGNCTKEEEISYTEQEWKDLLSLLQKDKEGSK